MRSRLRSSSRRLAVAAAGVICMPRIILRRLIRWLNSRPLSKIDQKTLASLSRKTLASLSRKTLAGSAREPGDNAMEVSFAKEVEALRLGQGQVFHGEGILAITKAL